MSGRVRIGWSAAVAFGIAGLGVVGRALAQDDGWRAVKQEADELQTAGDDATALNKYREALGKAPADKKKVVCKAAYRSARSESDRGEWAACAGVAAAAPPPAKELAAVKPVEPATEAATPKRKAGSGAKKARSGEAHTDPTPVAAPPRETRKPPPWVFQPAPRIEEPVGFPDPRATNVTRLMSVPATASPFSMGSTDGYPDEFPVHPVMLSAYGIDEYEVSVEQYRQCVEANQCTKPDDTTLYCNYDEAGRAKHPINCVKFEQARAYCRFVGKRLPTEAEWEYAARGPRGLRWPWGNEPDPGAQVCWRGEGCDDTQRLSTCPVKTYPNDKSPFGVYNMAGNVWEWVDDLYAPYQPGPTQTDPHGPVTSPYSDARRVARGGSWFDDVPSLLRGANRIGKFGGLRGDILGFRCARGVR